MVLPLLNDSPKYSVTIPSTNKRVHFRPYLVKEEKVLLLAMESNDPTQTLTAVADTVISCIHEEVKRESLTTFDVEYLFMKIRSKSVGEKSHIVLNCSECKAQNEYTLDLDSIELNIEERPSKIKLNDNVSIKMRWPSYVDMALDTHISKSSSATDQAFSVLIHCIESIQTEEENFVVKDIPRDEVVNFIESMSTSQYKAISEFMKKMPRLEHEIKFECDACQHENSIKLDSIHDFF